MPESSNNRCFNIYVSVSNNTTWWILNVYVFKIALIAFINVCVFKIALTIFALISTCFTFFIISIFVHLILWIPSAVLFGQFDDELAINLAVSVSCKIVRYSLCNFFHFYSENQILCFFDLRTPLRKSKSLPPEWILWVLPDFLITSTKTWDPSHKILNIVGYIYFSSILLIETSPVLQHAPNLNHWYML